MNEITLVIGSKNYSSWSLRPWLLLREFGIPFREVKIPFGQADTSANIRSRSPSGKVPLLEHGHLKVWDSLAICEYVSEALLDGAGWPADLDARARARSVSAEMHSGFEALRSAWPMNCRHRGRIEASEPVQRDIARIDRLWSDCLGAKDKGSWLFGDFSIADCMFAPVALRFHSYQPDLSPAAARYVGQVLGNVHVQAWMEAGRQEAEVVKEYAR